MSSTSNSEGGWLIPVWIECLEGSMEEKLHWMPKVGVLTLNLTELTLTDDPRKIAFNRNRAVYYELSIQF